MDLDQTTFIPGRNTLEAGQVLQPDPSTYELLHSLTTTWPCLSLDIVRDNLGENRKTYPATVYAVAGTQADQLHAADNEILVMKLSGLSRMDRTIEDSDDEDSDDENAEAVLETKSIPVGSTTNRIRARQFKNGDMTHTLTATMTENADVLVHDITEHLSAFDIPGHMLTAQSSAPLAKLRMHRSEGYAVAWSPLVETGKLLTGDNDGKIFVTSGTDGARFVSDTKPFTGHTGSVEDLQWSPNEKSVFASASSDGTVRIWDARSKSKKPARTLAVSSTDVNVLSWSNLTHHLLATGADDGEWAVWDLRSIKDVSEQSTSKPVASYTFHKEQITSVEWHPTDDSVVAVAAGDNTLTLWDLAVELDDEESRDTAGVQDVPPQLLFQHHMSQVKEFHWHPQIPGCVMATGGDGFGYVGSVVFFIVIPLISTSVFKTISV